MLHSTPTSFPAFAKINLALWVSAPFPPTHPKPGYHEIASWMSCIDLHDDLLIAPAANSAMTIRWADQSPHAPHAPHAPHSPQPQPIDWPIEKDLAFRAWKLLEAHTGRALHAHIQLIKRIPIGGGLGGGSSDAAAMLMGLNRLFKLDVPAESLRALGGQLGSDIAFFIDDVADPARPAAPALVRGLGDQIIRVGHISADILLIVPPVHCPTRPVYQAFDRMIASKTHTPTDITGFNTLAARVRDSIPHSPIDDFMLFNDLAAAAEAIQPFIADYRARISDSLAGVKVHVTGSGSCMFIATFGGVQDSHLRGRYARAAQEAACIGIWTSLIGGGPRAGAAQPTA